MAIVQISKIQHRTGNLIDLPQLSDAELGWASDANRLFIGTTPPQNIEVLTSYSTISFSQIDGSANANINLGNVVNGQILAYDSSSVTWTNKGGNASDPGNSAYYSNTNIHLGNVSNVKIGGGVNGYVLQTDGSGNLSWTEQLAGTPGNGLPGGANTQIQFNDGGFFGGTTGFTFDKVSGAVAMPGTVSVSNTVTATRLISNIATGTAPFTVTSTTQVANLNVATAGLATFATTANSVAGANVSGQVSFAATANAVAGANVTGTVSSATTAGTVTTAAQPNITSVGTLSSLTVGGHIIPSADITYDLGNATNAFRDLYLSGNTIRLGNGGATITANASAVIITGPGGTAVPVKPGGANTQVQYNDDGIFGGNPGMVFNEGTTTLTVNNFAVTSTADLSTTTLTIKNITTGANTTQGNITGNWVLTAGSKLQATYADLAEYYEADQVYAPGTVLEFGGDKEVTLAEDGTSRVAGVVSTDPAYAMNMKCPGLAVALALQGRVPTKVRGKIHKGDMMVSGGNGFARPSSAPQMGTVIGKALENFDGIEGIIEIAVGRL